MGPRSERFCSCCFVLNNEKCEQVCMRQRVYAGIAEDTGQRGDDTPYDSRGSRKGRGDILEGTWRV